MERIKLLLGLAGVVTKAIFCIIFVIFFVFDKKDIEEIFEVNFKK